MDGKEWEEKDVVGEKSDDADEPDDEWSEAVADRDSTVDLNDGAATTNAAAFAFADDDDDDADDDDDDDDDGADAVLAVAAASAAVAAVATSENGVATSVVAGVNKEVATEVGVVESL